MVSVMKIALDICGALPGFPDLGKTKASWILLIAGASVLKWPGQSSCGSHLLLTRALLTVLQFIFKKIVQPCFSVLFFQFFPSERLELEEGGKVCCSRSRVWAGEREREDERKEKKEEGEEEEKENADGDGVGCNLQI